MAPGRDDKSVSLAASKQQISIGEAMEKVADARENFASAASLAESKRTAARAEVAEAMKKEAEVQKLVVAALRKEAHEQVVAADLEARAEKDVANALRVEADARASNASSLAPTDLALQRLRENQADRAQKKAKHDEVTPDREKPASIQNDQIQALQRLRAAEAERAQKKKSKMEVAPDKQESLAEGKTGQETQESLDHEPEMQREIPPPPPVEGLETEQPRPNLNPFGPEGFNWRRGHP